MTDPTTSTQHLNSDQTTCRSCGEKVEWVTLNGKPHPIDHEPNGDGNLIRVGIDNGVAVVKTLSKVERLERIRSGETYGPDGGPGLWMSHFATCPQAASWRTAASRHVKREKRDAHFDRRRRS